MVLPVVIVIVAIFLLLWGFLGLNGTYVCVEDSNQYYSFSFSKFINVDPNYLFERTGGSFIVKSGKIKFNTKFGAVGKELLNAMGVDGKYELDFEKIDGTKVIKIDGKIFVRVSRKQANEIIGKSVYANNYAESEIRKWLNDTFYNVAFNTLQKELIQITEIDNSVSSTGYDSNIYACENTFDKVFLLSYAEMFLYLTNVLDGQMKSTDYAKSQGCWQSTDSDYNGNCRWWLRSPIVVYSDTVRNVYYNGEAYGKNTVHINECGVVPALVISLS